MNSGCVRSLNLSLGRQHTVTGQQTQTATTAANKAPTTVGTISDQTLRVGSTDFIGITPPPSSTIFVSNLFSDPESDTLTYSATSSDTSIATVSLLGTTVTTTLITTAVAAGEATITLTATDVYGATATQTFTATVEPNSAPTTVGSIPTQTVSVTQTAPTIDVSSYFSDPDKNPLTYTATSSDTSKATVSLSDATLTITVVAAGSATITVTATDTANATATQTFSVSVTSNRSPVAVGSIPTQTVVSVELLR